VLRDGLMLAGAGAAAVVAAWVAVLGAHAALGGGRAADAAAPSLPSVPGAQVTEPQAAAPGSARRGARAGTSRRADVVRARHAVVGARVALADGRLDAAARVGARVVGAARRHRAIAAVAERIRGHVRAAAGAAADVVRALDPVVAVGRRPDAALGGAVVVVRARVAVVTRRRLRRRLAAPSTHVSDAHWSA
jgi:hypothetical protein